MRVTYVEDLEVLDEEDAYINVKVVDYLVAGVVSQARLPFGCPSSVTRVGDELVWEIDYSVLKVRLKILEDIS